MLSKKKTITKSQNDEFVVKALLAKACDIPSENKNLKCSSHLEWSEMLLLWKIKQPAHKPALINAPQARSRPQTFLMLIVYVEERRDERHLTKKPTAVVVSLWKAQEAKPEK